MSTMLPQPPPDRRRVPTRRIKLMLVAFFGGHLLFTQLTQGIRVEHVVLDVGVFLLAATSGLGLALFEMGLPILLAGILYDNMRFLLPLRRVVQVDPVYELERSLFGIGQGLERIVPSIWAQSHTYTALDLVCGAAYVLYLPWVVAGAIWLFARGRRVEARVVAWSMLVCTLVGVTVQFAYPVAPPWYVDDFGLGPANLGAVASAAGASRFDALLGITYFREFYARNPNVFGAMPSLHVCYAAVMMFAVARLGRGWRAATVTFTGLMAFSAVYLNHHYILDVLAGIVLGAATVATVARVLRSPPGGMGPAPARGLALLLLAWTGFSPRPAAAATAAALALHPVGDEFYSEQISLMVLLDDGRYLHAQMGATNVGPGSRQGTCRVTVVTAPTKHWSAADAFSHREWSHQDGPPEVLRFGEACELRATESSLSARIELDGGTVRVEIAAGPHSTTPPGSRIEAGSSWYEYSVLVPWADASVAMRLPGGLAETANSGRAHVDRSRSTTRPRELATYWMRVRRLTPGSEYLAVVRVLPDLSGAVGWSWGAGQDKPTRVGSASLRSLGAQGTWRLDIDGERFDANRLQLRAAPLEEIRFGGAVRALIGNPVTYTHLIGGGVVEVTDLVGE